MESPYFHSVEPHNAIPTNTSYNYKQTFKLSRFQLRLSGILALRHHELHHPRRVIVLLPYHRRHRGFDIKHFPPTRPFTNIKKRNHAPRHVRTFPILALPYIPALFPTSLTVGICSVTEIRIGFFDAATFTGATTASWQCPSRVLTASKQSPPVWLR